MTQTSTHQEEIPEPQSTGFVIVRLKRPALKEPQGLEGVLNSDEMSRCGPLVSMPVEELLEFEDRARQAGSPPDHSLTQYWSIDMRDDPGRIPEVVKELDGMSEVVDLAYPHEAGNDPCPPPPPDDPFHEDQTYLDPAPVGIDAEWAWNKPGGEGQNACVTDLEQEWVINHEAYRHTQPTVIKGQNRVDDGTGTGDHGASVLGAIASARSPDRLIGIAPRVKEVYCASHYKKRLSRSGFVSDAVAEAWKKMGAGGILVLEYEIRGAPAEQEDAIYNALQIAHGNGITVVEAAGYGAGNLDLFEQKISNKKIFAANSRRDRHAIIVSSAKSDGSRKRLGRSSYGSRVDCFAVGKGVVSAGYGDLHSGVPEEKYTRVFGKTSASTASVAGAAVILQSVYHSMTNGRWLRPVEMRARLTDAATNTPAASASEGIGVMPDLRKIIEKLERDLTVGIG